MAAGVCLPTTKTQLAGFAWCQGMSEVLPFILELPCRERKSAVAESVHQRIEKVILSKLFWSSHACVQYTSCVWLFYFRKAIEAFHQVRHDSIIQMTFSFQILICARLFAFAESF